MITNSYSKNNNVNKEGVVLLSNSTPAIDRIFFQYGSFTIYWYSVIIITGIIIGIFLANKEADRLGLKKDIITDLMVFVIPIAIIFARIYYVTFEWKQYVNQPFSELFAVWNGGIAIHGAIIGSVLTVIIYTHIKKISFWQIVDILAPSLILGQAIGRWGNFMNQEAHGGPISETIYNNFHQYLPDFIMNQMTIDGVMYHPTFLYESFWNIIVLILLLILRKYNPLRGEVFLSYVTLYSIGRFVIEGMRMDSLYLGQFRVAQLVSVLLIVGAISLIFYRRKMGQENYEDKSVIKKST